MISALCGGLLGIAFGSACMYLTGLDPIPLVLTLIGASTVFGAIVGYRFPYAPDILRLLVDWLK